MKVTALISDELINEVKVFTKGKNITESLLIALNDWVSREKIKKLNRSIKMTPLEFKDSFTHNKIRKLNRR